MTKLEKYTLARRDDRKWALTKDGSDRATKIFANKEVATRENNLKDAIGSKGGLVKIKKVDGTFQEERTFPRCADPGKSPR